LERDILWREFRRREIKKMLIRRLERIYEQKLEVVIRMNQRYTVYRERASG